MNERVARALALEREAPVYTRYKKRKHGGGYRYIYKTDDEAEKRAQRAVKDILEGNYEPRFSDTSFGYRSGRSATQALESVELYINEGFMFAAKLDVKKCFDSIPHCRLIETLKHVPNIEGYLPFIERTLYTKYRSEDGTLRSFWKKGFMQGMILAPMYCNIYLNKVDWWMHRNWQDVKYVRYADDILILARSKLRAKKAVAGLKRYINQSLDLKVTINEPISLETGSIVYLGFNITLDGAGHAKLTPSISAFSRLVFKVSVALEEGEDVNSIITGWQNYYQRRVILDPLSGIPVALDVMGDRLRACH